MPTARSKVKRSVLRYTTSSSSRFVSRSNEGIKRSTASPSPNPMSIADEVVISPDRNSKAVPIKAKTIPQCRWCQRTFRVERVNGLLKYKGTMKNKTRYQMIPMANAIMKYIVVLSIKSIYLKSMHKKFFLLLLINPFPFRPKSPFKS